VNQRADEARALVGKPCWEVGNVFVVELRSEMHGDEPFRYETLTEALAGARRLERACNGAYAKDGVEREIVLVLARIGEEEDSTTEEEPEPCGWPSIG